MDRIELLAMVVVAREELAKINAILDKALVALAKGEKPAVNQHPGMLNPINPPPFYPPSFREYPKYEGPGLPWNGNIVCKAGDGHNHKSVLDTVGYPHYNPLFDEGKTRVHSCD